MQNIAQRGQKIAMRGVAAILFAYLALVNVKIVGQPTARPDQAMEETVISASFPSAVASFYLETLDLW